MADRVLDMHPSRITIDALGPAGQRIFLLQAGRDNTMITLKMEKQQAVVLAASIDRMLDELGERFPREVSRLEEPVSSDLMLQEPFDVQFVVGQMGMGYDQAEDAMVLVLQELILEEGAKDAQVARLWATRGQMNALSRHIKEVVAQGRPICAMCGQPIDPDGHLCPKSNGREPVH